MRLASHSFIVSGCIDASEASYASRPRATLSTRYIAIRNYNYTALFTYVIYLAGNPLVSCCSVVLSDGSYQHGARAQVRVRSTHICKSSGVAISITLSHTLDSSVYQSLVYRCLIASRGSAVSKYIFAMPYSIFPHNV